MRFTKEFDIERKPGQFYMFPSQIHAVIVLFHFKSFFPLERCPVCGSYKKEQCQYDWCSGPAQENHPDQVAIMEKMHLLVYEAQKTWYAFRMDMDISEATKLWIATGIDVNNPSGKPDWQILKYHLEQLRLVTNAKISSVAEYLLGLLFPKEYDPEEEYYYE